jgi:hypothetical protein
MKPQLLLIPILLLAASTAGAATPTSDHPNEAAAAFTRLKSLVGEWEADTPMGKAHLTYELIAGGTALVERETMGDMPAMMTVYHLDGDRLLLTHYCVTGNQPRLQARRFDPATGEVAFEFLDATNLASPRAGHMHNVKIRLSDNNHFTSEWEFYDNGERKNTEAAQYTRLR